MRQNKGHTLPMLALVVAAAVMVLGWGCPEALGVYFGLHQVDFLGASYDAGTNSTTFSYRVTAAAGYPIDSWTVELDPECFGEGDILDASEAWVYVGPDPFTQIYGIQFTTPYAPGESRDVWFRLAGNVIVGFVRIDVRQDCSHWVKEMQGPECDGVTCTPAECDVAPDRDSVVVGSDVTFTATATGTAPFTYCWQKEPYTDPCISVTNQLTLNYVTMADAGTYRVLVTNECGEDTCYVVLVVYEPPPEGEGQSPGYWGNQLAIYLGLKNGKLKEPDVGDYCAEHGYTAEQAYAIFSIGEGGTSVEKLHRQLLAAKLSAAAGYLTNVDELLEWGQYMVAHPEEFTEQEILDAKDLFESLHD
jgi:hypothetical protein